MPDICTDNRFELIDKYKTKLLDSTNIETSPEEMAVIDNILFRFWQMGWLDKLESVNAEPVKHGRWIKMSDAGQDIIFCSECGYELPRVINSFNPQFDLFPKLKCIDKTTYCPNCSAKMDNV